MGSDDATDSSDPDESDVMCQLGRLYSRLDAIVGFLVREYCRFLRDYIQLVRTLFEVLCWRDMPMCIFGSQFKLTLSSTHINAIEQYQVRLLAWRGTNRRATCALYHRWGLSCEEYRPN
jgi:hypothetical protein